MIAGNVQHFLYKSVVSVVDGSITRMRGRRGAEIRRATHISPVEDYSAGSLRQAGREGKKVQRGKGRRLGRKRRGREWE